VDTINDDVVQSDVDGISSRRMTVRISWLLRQANLSRFAAFVFAVAKRRDARAPH
jgi:hypothetical protein